MENLVKIEGMVKEEPRELEDVEDEALQNTYVKVEPEERDDSDNEEFWTTHELKTEQTALDYLEEVKLEVDDEELKTEQTALDYLEEVKLEVDDEEEVKPPLLILVQPNNADDNYNNCEERNIFDKDSGMPNDRDSRQKGEKDAYGGVGSCSTPCGSSFSSQECSVTSRSKSSWRRVKFQKRNTIAFCNDTSTKKVHKTKLRPFHCNECDAKFTQKSRLAVHMRKHTGQRPFRCDVCDASFTQSGSLTKHMRKHTGERPYQCDECDAAFTQLSNLKDHIRLHTGERPFSCNECDASFTQSGSLKVHMRTHTGQRPFHCNECDASFTQSGSLKAHVKKHTG